MTRRKRKIRRKYKKDEGHKKVRKYFKGGSTKEERRKRATAAKKVSKSKLAATGRKIWEKRKKYWRTKEKFLLSEVPDTLPTTGTTVFDGRTVPNWFIPDLKEARKSGMWWGSVISGVRTAAQSIALCWAICKAAFCPGLCAGANSNHNAEAPVEPGDGAIDVTDHIGLARYMAWKYGPNKSNWPFKNTLANDQNHYSKSGG